MSEAPERIWAWDDRTPTERDKGWSACDAGTGSTEYIRADLVPPPGWQPIETAPSEARILVYVPRYGVTTAHKGTDFSGDSRFICHSILNKEDQPTHWMPLPAPPSEDNP